MRTRDRFSHHCARVTPEFLCRLARRQSSIDPGTAHTGTRPSSKPDKSSNGFPSYNQVPAVLNALIRANTDSDHSMAAWAFLCRP